jgi:ectoine hydroxylase
MNEPFDLYPSRTGNRESLLPRLDPVVYEDPRYSHSEFSLTEDQVASYEENGFLVIPDYLPELVSPLNEEIDSLKDRMAGAEELYTEPDSNALRTVFKPFAHSRLIDSVSRDPRILQPVMQLLGSQAYIMQSRINVKPAFTGKSFPWHSDFETWHVEDGMPRMRALTAWIMLTENTAHNGPLYVVPGSHKRYISCAGRTGKDNYKTSLKRQTLGVPRQETMREVLEDHDIVAVEGKPGSLVIHECNLLHGSPDNISADPRTILMFVYNSVLNRPVAPFGGVEPRPHYLSNPDTAALEPLAAPLTEEDIRWLGAGPAPATARVA